MNRRTAVLVTGANGFLGSSVVEALLRNTDRHVVGWGRNPVRLADLRRRLASFHSRLTVETADLLEPASLPGDVRTIVHCAAIRSVVPGQDESILTRVNEDATRCLVDCASDLADARFLYVSSQSVYGPEGAPWDETAEPSPVTAYGRSKLAGERAALRHGARIDVVVVRLSRLYGATPFARWHELPGVFVRQVIDRRPLTVHGTGTSRYDLLHVSDAATGIVELLFPSRSLHHRVYNLGGGGNVSIGELAELVADVASRMGLPRPRISHDPERMEGEAYLELDVRRVVAETPWRPRVSLLDGVRGYFEAAGV